MSKKTNSSTNQPLTDVRVLVGRAKHQAGALSTELRKLGAQVLEIPFIEIRKPRSFKPLDSALKNLPTYDWLILTSVNGVEAMWTRMEKLERPAEISREGRLIRAALDAIERSGFNRLSVHCASPPSAQRPRRRLNNAASKSTWSPRNTSPNRSSAASKEK